jgi:hypothetical protein
MLRVISPSLPPSPPPLFLSVSESTGSSLSLYDRENLRQKCFPAAWRPIQQNTRRRLKTKGFEFFYLKLLRVSACVCVCVMGDSSVGGERVNAEGNPSPGCRMGRRITISNSLRTSARAPISSHVTLGMVANLKIFFILKFVSLSLSIIKRHTLHALQMAAPSLKPHQNLPFQWISSSSR